MALLSFNFLAAAASVDGKWTAEVPGRNGTPATQTFNLKSSGDKVEGTVTQMRQGMPVDSPITDGKLSGDTLTFTVVRSRQGQDFKISYTGKVKADSIDFSVDMGRGDPQTFTAKKAQ